MTPLEALNILAQAAALAPLPLASHQQVQLAVQALAPIVQSAPTRSARKSKS